MTAFCLGTEKLACLWFIFKWITHHIWIKSTVISEDFSFTFFFSLSESRETRLRATQNHFLLGEEVTPLRSTWGWEGVFSCWPYDLVREEVEQAAAEVMKAFVFRPGV